MEWAEYFMGVIILSAVGLMVADMMLEGIDPYV